MRLPPAAITGAVALLSRKRHHCPARLPLKVSVVVCAAEAGLKLGALLQTRVEALQLVFLAGEGLHHAHARDVLLGVRGELGDALLHLLHRGACAAPVTLGDEDHEGHRRHRDHAERGVGSRAGVSS